jgi:hypothetical protein
MEISQSCIVIQVKLVLHIRHVWDRIDALNIQELSVTEKGHGQECMQYVRRRTEIILQGSLDVYIIRLIYIHYYIATTKYIQYQRLLSLSPWSIFDSL